MGAPYFDDEKGMLCYNAGVCAELALREFIEFFKLECRLNNFSLHSRHSSQDIPDRTGERWLVLFLIGDLQRRPLESPHED